MAYRLLGSLFAAALLAACAQTDAPDPAASESAEAPPPAMPETDVMKEEKASMEQAMAGEAAEAPAPATMPSSYTVFFAFNSAILTAEAESVIDEAALAAASQGAASIGVVGYADGVGSSGQNETMSRWRAQAVADELVFRGIPATALQVEWLGSADTVASRDPDQSERRVEIDIR